MSRQPNQPGPSVDPGLCLALMELLSAESWSVFLLALVPVMALATLAGIALAVILEDLGRRRA